MANQPLINKFTKGVNTDIAEELLPNTFLSNGHNIKLTNDDNKQGIVQKQESYIKELNGYGVNLKPLAARSFNNVIYIISYNMETGITEYGTYPSADISGIDIGTEDVVRVPKVYVYAPLALITNKPFDVPETGVVLIINRLPSSSPSFVSKLVPFNTPSSITLATSSTAYKVSLENSLG